MKWFVPLMTTVMGVLVPEYAVALKEENTCGYKACPEYDSAMLNIHIVPHTHNDLGWLNTVDQYYYGSVQYILDTVVNELWENPARRFVYVETAFFWKWWQHQPHSVRAKVHTLVHEGRLQFAGGAWSMNDEATTHYQSLIDQFTLGLNKLNITFGECGRPLVGWQIDPFGHSREFASLIATMGYDGLFLGRIDHQDKKNRMEKKMMEMLWRGDDDLGKSSDIFTTVLFNGYMSPPGFCFDDVCHDEPLVDDKFSPAFNVDNKTSLFLHYVQKQANYYRTNNILVPFGGDFKFQDAGMVFRNLDKLIQNGNTKAALEEMNITMYYSTPTCYLKAVMDSEPTLPIKQDDFFPYSTEVGYWTGFYTSRPTIKFFERQANKYLQMVKQLQVLADLDRSNEHFIEELKSAMGVLQHHDAITGTERGHVAHDYERILDQAIDGTVAVVRQALNKYMYGNALRLSKLTFNRCKFNESSCFSSENSDQFIVALYNPLAWNITVPVRIPVVNHIYEVFSPTGEEIQSQLVEIQKLLLSLPLRESNATHEIVFIARLQAVSYKTFYIRKAGQQRPAWLNRRTTIDYNQTTTERYVHSYYLENDNRSIYQTFLMSNIKKREAVNDDIHDTALNDSTFDISMEDSMRIEEITGNRVDAKSLDLGVNVSAETTTEDDYVATLPTVKPEDVVLDNQYMKVVFNKNGDVTKIIFKDGTEMQFTIRNSYYSANYFQHEEGHHTSGAYIFGSSDLQSVDMRMINTIQGNIVKEVRFISSKDVRNNLILYEGLNYLECEWLVGPINAVDRKGKEYVIQYMTNVKSRDEFFTDSNGRQIIKRKRDKRPTWEFDTVEPIPANFYPVTNKIFINDERLKIAVLTDRAQGGTSADDGEIELMLHRRLFEDDSLGLLEALNEINDFEGLVVRGKHRVLISDAENKEQYINEKKEVIQFHLEPIVLVAEASQVSLEDWFYLPNKTFSWMHNVPNGIHLLTLESWGNKTLLLRLENYLETYDLDNTTIEVNLAAIFKNIQVISVKETTLGANMWYEDYIKKVWNTEKQFSCSFNDDYGNYGGKFADNIDEIHDCGMIVHFKAKQIRTFVVDYLIL